MPRREIVIDQNGTPVGDVPAILPAAIQAELIGVPGSGMRSWLRLVYAAALNRSDTGPLQVAPATLLAAADGSILADPSGAMFGSPPVWVHRMVYAERVRQTRRLG